MQGARDYAINAAIAGAGALLAHKTGFLISGTCTFLVGTGIFQRNKDSTRLPIAPDFVSRKLGKVALTQLMSWAVGGSPSPQLLTAQAVILASAPLIASDAAHEGLESFEPLVSLGMTAIWLGASYKQGLAATAPYGIALLWAHAPRKSERTQLLFYLSLGSIALFRGEQLWQLARSWNRS